MKRLIAGLIGFGVPALGAILVGLAPLNAVSLQLAAIFGGSNAVAILLVLAVALGIGGFLLFKPKPADTASEERDGKPIAAWTPPPLSPDFGHDSAPLRDAPPASPERLEELRRAAFPDDYADQATDADAIPAPVTMGSSAFTPSSSTSAPSTAPASALASAPVPPVIPTPAMAPPQTTPLAVSATVEPAQPASDAAEVAPADAPAASGATMVPVPTPAKATPPVVLIRKARERDRDWFGDTSWFGGLPRLGDAAWPRDAAGTPLPFAAQIDLASLNLPEDSNPLPRSGSLAFFLGSGAVIAVPELAEDFTDPPHDLMPVYNEGGEAFPTRESRLGRFFFPFWPVDAVTLDLPEELRDHRQGQSEFAIQQAMSAQIATHAALRDHPYYAAGVGAPVETLWWHSVLHLTDTLHEALAHADTPVQAHEAALGSHLDELDALKAQPNPDADEIEDYEDTARSMAAELETLLQQREELPAMVAALEQFVDGREPWQALSPEELEVVADLLSEVHERFGELVRGHVPGTLAQLATVSVRTMVSGPADVLSALPDAMLARINSDYRLPPVDPHQMFGLPAGHAARHEQGQDILLLQLGYDDLMEWNWSESGLFQFWISPADAAAGNWSAARLTFESD